MHFIFYSYLFYLYRSISFYCFFFFNDTATTEIYTLSLHDALPISCNCLRQVSLNCIPFSNSSSALSSGSSPLSISLRSEEHTSELQSPDHLVCRLLLEKKKKTAANTISTTHS